MKDFFNKAKTAVTELATTTTNRISDAAKENKPSTESVKRATDFFVDTASKTATELSRLGKDALKTDLAKDAAAGAAIGAVVAVPIPFFGPIAGAVVGAGLGIYKNIGQPKPSRRADLALPVTLTSVDEAPLIEVIATPPASNEWFEKLTKLHELKVKGILTDEEFVTEKQKILKN